MRTEIFSAYESLNVDDRADNNYMSLFKRLKDAIEDPTDICLVDVFDQEDRTKILEQLLDSGVVAHPEDHFAIKISDKSTLSLKSYLSTQKYILKETGIKQCRYEIFAQKLNDLKFLNDELNLDEDYV